MNPMYLFLFYFIVSIITLIISTRFSIRTGFTLIIGAAALIGLPLPHGLRTINELLIAFTTKDSLVLLLTLGLFGYYNNILRNSKGIDHTIRYLNIKGLSVRKLLFVIPSILGLLINPGGVVLSLEAIEHLPVEVSKIQKGAACMFFRHVLYPILPLQPALMVLATQSNTPFSKLFIANLPVVILAEAIGYWIYIRPVQSANNQHAMEALVSKELFGTLISLILVVLIAIVTRRLDVAMLIGIIVFLVIAGMDKTNLLRDIDWNLILIGLGFILYRQAVTIRIESISNQMNLLPAYLINLALPGLIAFASGSCLISVGCALPILDSLFQKPEIGALQVLYFSAIIGYYFSPVHLCSLLAKEYAGVNFKTWYYALLKPLPAIAIGTCFLYFIKVF